MSKGEGWDRGGKEWSYLLLSFTLAALSTVVGSKSDNFYWVLIASVYILSLVLL